MFKPKHILHLQRLIRHQDGFWQKCKVKNYYPIIQSLLGFSKIESHTQWFPSPSDRFINEAHSERSIVWDDRTNRKKILFEVCELHFKNKKKKQNQKPTATTKKQPTKIQKTRLRMMVELFQMTMKKRGNWARKSEFIPLIGSSISVCFLETILPLKFSKMGV